MISPEQARLYLASYIEVTDYPAWFLRLTPELKMRREYPDVLVPLYAPVGGLPFEVRPGRTSVVWIDLHVPPGTPPGNYQGKLRIAPRNAAARELDVLLEVWPFALPQTRHLAMIAGLNTTELLRHHLEVAGQPYAPTRLSFEDPTIEKAVEVIDGAIRTLHEHRISPVLTDVYPRVYLDPDGNPRLDWTDYDRLIAGIVDGTLFRDRTAAFAWPLPVSDTHPLPETHGGWGSPTHQRALAEYLRQSAEHFQDKGWLDQHFVWIPLPGATRGERYEQFEELGRLIGNLDPRLKLLCALSPQSMSPYGWRKDGFRDVSAYAGIWSPPASLADPAELRLQHATGKRVWFTPDRAPFSGSLSVIAPPLHARTIAWQAYRFGLEGVLLPSINAWPADGKPRAVGSESALLWPGKPYGLTQPVPSIRLKRLLRGLQDVEYLWLLEQNRRPGVAQLIAEDLFAYGGTLCYGEHCLDGRPNGWVADPTAWSLARRLMARELITAFADHTTSTQPANPAEDLARFEQQIEWARLTETVRGARVKVEGVRVDIDPADTKTPVRLDATVSLYNATRKPISGEIRFTGGPEGWEATGDGLSIEEIASRQRARRTLTARVPAFVPNPNGIFEIQVELDRNGAEPVLAPARIAALTSQRLTKPITLDGRLDDWPLGTVNVAGDFVLVGARDVPKTGRRSPDRASQGTIVFVCHDSENIYFGFNCADDHLSERVISNGNTVQYNDLWPVGEDLVEVVLDPTNQAVDAGDLLHFLVKANGAVISEQGVPCLANVARHSDWPAGVAAAVDDTTHPDRWTVEIRIPIKALAARPGVWGVNFARFNARLGEYSSWSGARRYVYSPASLGNVRVLY